jgi:hypothetical protein
MKHPIGDSLRAKCPFMVSQNAQDQSSLMDKRELPVIKDSENRSSATVMEEVRDSARVHGR